MSKRFGGPVRQCCGVRRFTAIFPPLAWHFAWPSEDRIVLTGLDDHKDSIYVVPDRVDKDYALTKRTAPRTDAAIRKGVAASKH